MIAECVPLKEALDEPHGIVWIGDEPYPYPSGVLGVLERSKPMESEKVYVEFSITELWGLLASGGFLEDYVRSSLHRKYRNIFDEFAKAMGMTEVSPALECLVVDTVKHSVQRTIRKGLPPAWATRLAVPVSIPKETESYSDSTCRRRERQETDAS